MSLSLTIFLLGSTLFVAFAVLVQIERRNARRFAGGRLRDWLDTKVVIAEHRLLVSWHHFTRYIVKLGWYYGMHSLLRTIMQVLVSVYTFIEHIFERNRARTKQLRQEFKRQIKHTHFSQIAHHKAENALTPQQQEDLKTKKLEYDH